MNEVLVIEGTEVERIEYGGQPVLSLPMVDRVHQRPEGTAKRTFLKHREKLAVGEDFHELPYEEWEPLVGRETSYQRGQASHQKGGHRGIMIFLTLSGYLMLVKTFQDDLAWRVQRMLVQSYFRLKALRQSAEVTVIKDKLLALQQKHIELLESKRRIRRVDMALIRRVLELDGQGLGLSEIGREVGRNRSTISYILKRYGQ